jgi:signal transduction histidine kinase
MQNEHALHAHAERLISAARLVLAVGSLAALWLEPSEPARFAPFTYSILALYSAYAAGAAVVTWTSTWTMPARLTHAVDVAVSVALVFFTQWSTSPFFVYFVYSIVVATIRWSYHGAAPTVAFLVCVHLALGPFEALVLRDPAFELNRYIVRTVYLAVVGSLIAYLGWYQHLRRQQFAMLAEWPSATALDLRDLLQDVLERARRILSATRVVLVWEDGSEPWAEVAERDESGLALDRYPPERAGLVAGVLRPHHFYCRDLATGHCVVMDTETRELATWRGEPLEPWFAQRFPARSVGTWHVQVGDRECRLFAFDGPELGGDDLLLGEIVARGVVARLEQFQLTKELRSAAVTEERLRLARNLHDGVLQSLTGVALHLQSARRLLPSDADAAEQRLNEVQRLVAAEHYEIRSVIHQLRPEPAVPPRADVPVAGRLREISARVERQWGIAVRLSLDPEDVALPKALFEDVLLLAQEALINAVHHARPTRVEIAVRQAGGRIHLDVADDGRGFPFAGRVALPELMDRNIGPRTLRERVYALAGELEVESSAAGARVRLSIPLSLVGV